MLRLVFRPNRRVVQNIAFTYCDLRAAVKGDGLDTIVVFLSGVTVRRKRVTA